MDYNQWTERSIEFAKTQNYLDELFKVYPLEENEPRAVDSDDWQKIEKAYSHKNDAVFIDTLLNLETFPIKDAYVSFLRYYREALRHNPKTVKRLSARLYQLDITELKQMCERPKETNQQMGPLFKKWILEKNPLNLKLTDDYSGFFATEEDSVFIGSDNKIKEFAKEHLNYNINKGLDILLKYNNQFIIGEAKFVTSEGGNQRNQLSKTKQFLDDNTIKAKKIAILDGVIYIKENLLNIVTDEHNNHLNVFSALKLREFVYSL